MFTTRHPKKSKPHLATLTFRRLSPSFKQTACIEQVYSIVHVLIGGIPTPLKHMSSSMGMMTSHILWKIKNVPNHQPGVSIKVKNYTVYTSEIHYIDYMHTLARKYQPYTWMENTYTIHRYYTSIHINIPSGKQPHNYGKIHHF